MKEYKVIDVNFDSSKDPAEDFEGELNYAAKKGWVLSKFQMVRHYQTYGVVIMEREVPDPE